MLDLTNCTFDGHMYNARRVMEECLAIKPDLIFLWDEAWFGFARFSPFLRPRTAMGAAGDDRGMAARPGQRCDAYEAQQARAGREPVRTRRCSTTRLMPDPRKVRLRVYQTNSTHKSMSALRQGSMLLVKDVDFRDVEAQFHEAVFTHASTSPNQQLIASLDVARRQMELEGYELVMNAIEIALEIRAAINSHPLISKYFRVLGADEMIPARVPAVRLRRLPRRRRHLGRRGPGDAGGRVLPRSRRASRWSAAPPASTAPQFKGLLADEYDIQINKTSRNSVLLQTNINNTRSDVAHLIRVLVEICARHREAACRGRRGREARRSPRG